MSHQFGGPWTLIKLDVLKAYLGFFNIALQNQPKPDRPFRRIYIDAFAGTGSCDIRVSTTSKQHMTVEGSAAIALQTHPEFNEHHFIDFKKAHTKELKTLCAAHASRQSFVYQDDANAAIRQIVNQVNWRSSRAVLFLDPYGMTVDWSTLQYVAQTKAIDVWYLFPLSGFYRQAANSLADIDEDKAQSLTKILGTTEWRKDLYASNGQADLFGSDPESIRTLGPIQLAAYVKTRLSTIFEGAVLEPAFLSHKNIPLYALFFAVSNPSRKAVALSTRTAQHLLVNLDATKHSTKSAGKTQIAHGLWKAE